jgi:hypothetical protein
MLTASKIARIKANQAKLFAGRAQTITLHGVASSVPWTLTVQGIIRGQEDNPQSGTVNTIRANANAEVRTSDVTLAQVRQLLYLTLPSGSPDTLAGEQFTVVGAQLKGLMPGGDRYILALFRIGATPTGSTGGTVTVTDDPQAITITTQAGVGHTPTTVTTNAVLVWLREGDTAAHQGTGSKHTNQLLFQSADVSLAQLRSTVYVTILGEKYHVDTIETQHAGLSGALYLVDLHPYHAQTVDLTLKAAGGSTSTLTCTAILAGMAEDDPDLAGGSSAATMELRTAEIDLPTLRSCLYVTPNPVVGIAPATRYLITSISSGGTRAGGDRLICSLERQRV